MSGWKNSLVILGFAASGGLITAAFAVVLTGGSVLFAAIGFLTGLSLFIAAFSCRNRKEAMRIQALAEYLEQVNTGKAVILSATGEDDFSKLEDEIYKTVTFLYQTKETEIGRAHV